MQPVSLKPYRSLARWIPLESLRAKMFASAFCATHVPLVTLFVFLALTDGRIGAVQSVVLVLLATLAGTALVLWALHALLAPTRMALDALALYNTRRIVQPLPTDLRDDMGDLLRGIRSTLESVEERRCLLQQLAIEDGLTGLPNRRHAEDYLNLAAAAAERGGARLSVAMLDIDGFGALNEKLGRDHGDRLLRRTGEFLKLWLRRKGDWVARWQNDQFIAIQFAEQDAAAEFFDNLRREFQRQMGEQEGRAISLSIGVAEMQRGESIAACRDRAATCLDQARSAGGDTVSGAPPLRSASGKVVALGAAATG